ncbi:hypothetical protein J2S73_000524 [Amorphus orientalis]|uniref:Uncharacterized protein n=1 Tax=Amorphus orientalis TaxID=649198 RepID=A0AAE3VL80_9HYPH|nr:hypothetical protein [Amorphus orientalis]
MDGGSGEYLPDVRRVIAGGEAEPLTSEHVRVLTRGVLS